VLRKKSPDIPLYKEIMTYTNFAKETEAVNKQHLLWNLKNNVKFEDLPTNQQAFLLKMDPLSYMKVNNLIKSEVKSQLTKFTKTQLPLYNQVKDAVSLVKGKAHTYEEYAKNIENIAVKAKLIDNTAPIKADGYDIFTQTRSSGFSATTITFININTFPIVITCTSFLDPFRPVQPIGFDFPKFFEEHEKYEDEIKKEILTLLGKIGSYLGYIGEGEIKTLKDNPDKINELFKAYSTKKLSYKRTQKEFGYNGEDDISDAFRHAYWSAAMVRELGAALAEEVATNHEIGATNQKAKDMDLHNNKIGRDIAAELILQGISDDDSFAKEILKNKDNCIVLVHLK
jgi:hypothetical protein